MGQIWTILLTDGQHACRTGIGAMTATHCLLLTQQAKNVTSCSYCLSLPAYVRNRSLRNIATHLSTRSQAKRLFTSTIVHLIALA